MTDSVTYVLGVDPGDVHAGFAEWWTGERGIRCWELPAPQALATVRARMDSARRMPGIVSCVLVVEAFQLYADKSAAQTGSSMRTSQMIGALKLTAEQLAVAYEGQGALVKTAMRAQCKARGIELCGSIHAKDAGLHTAHYVLYNRLGLRN